MPPVPVEKSPDHRAVAPNHNRVDILIKVHDSQNVFFMDGDLISLPTHISKPKIFSVTFPPKAVVANSQSQNNRLP